MGTLVATSLADPAYPAQGLRYDYSGFGITLAAGDYWFVAHPHYPHFDREIVYAGTGMSANAERVETIVGDGPNYGPLYGAGPQVGLRLEGIAVVPEPTSWALMLGGFGVAGAGLRLRRRQTAG
ncbi:PEPxxWA-CTERM sorting domain-containing protein [Sphingosinicellaceae bacterium]|nr:PEPxxWA-CTERM sorting domain-containing protein [Sphingosinicellaceae bacterium]